MQRRSLILYAVAASLGLAALLAGCGSEGGDGSGVALSPAGERGQVVAKEQGCISCHTSNGQENIGPTWKGLAGSTVRLDDGTEVVADDAYLRSSILQPKAQLVEGYGSVMPIYEGELTDAELDDLIAYLNDLAAPPAAGSDGGGN